MWSALSLYFFVYPNAENISSLVALQPQRYQVGLQSEMKLDIYIKKCSHSKIITNKGYIFS